MYFCCGVSLLFLYRTSTVDLYLILLDYGGCSDGSHRTYIPIPRNPTHKTQGKLTINSLHIGEPLNAGPSCVRICAGLHNASGTPPQKPKNTHGSRNTPRTKNHTKNQLRRTPKRKTPAQQQQQQSTPIKQAPSTMSSIRVYQSTGV